MRPVVGPVTLVSTSPVRRCGTPGRRFEGCERGAVSDFVYTIGFGSLPFP